MKMNYEEIKRLAAETGMSIKNFLVLADQNDPFHAGTKTDIAMAEWFTNMWHEFGYETGIHLRRIHYQLVSQEDPRKHNGEPYENTINCWLHLGQASRLARYLDYVPVSAFIDRRNPDPHIFQEYEGSGRSVLSWNLDNPYWNIPLSETEFTLDLPEASIYGYNYTADDQDYHIEIWAEKSAMNDVLIPICRNLGINLITSLGFQSITAVVEMLDRVKECGKEARIFYISDFDPAGDNMPTAVARQVEFWLRGSDVKLTPLVLTKDQVKQYRLPRIPIKDTDRSGKYNKKLASLKTDFEDRYGEGAVELDALEALHPGELDRIVREAVLPYRDMDLNERLQDAREEAQGTLDEEIENLLDPYQQKITDLENAIREKIKAYQVEMEPYQSQLEALYHDIAIEAEEIVVNLPEQPEAELEYQDEDDWLFDSDREYEEQLEVYKKFKNGGEA